MSVGLLAIRACGAERVVECVMSECQAISALMCPLFSRVTADSLALVFRLLAATLPPVSIWRGATAFSMGSTPSAFLLDYGAGEIGFRFSLVDNPSYGER